MLFIGTQVTIIILGLLPLRFWRSFQAKPPTPNEPKVLVPTPKPV
jgi:hypothetical protein